MLNPIVIEHAYNRIKNHIHRTPVLHSSKLNDMLGGHEIFFKCEMFQKIGAFKARGALNALLKMQEEGTLPERIVTVSSGNHAQATAFAAGQFHIPVTVFMSKTSSPLKIQATKGYG